MQLIHKECGHLEYKLYLEKNGSRDSYGIEVFEHSKSVRRIPDMGNDKSNLNKLVSLLNEMDTGLSELDYIIEDYLTFFDV